jgi:glycerol-3-phosphate dehydrogenase (NAD(P)+)
MKAPSIGVIGGGAFGTALADTLTRAGRDVLLYARKAETVDEINVRHTNSAYLPGATLQATLRATTDLAATCRRDVLLLSVPAQQVRPTATAMRVHVTAGQPIVLCAKGLEQATGTALSEVLADTLPGAIPAVLSGPSFAADMVRGLPTALTLATHEDAVGHMLVEALAARTFRLYRTRDVTGVELGGAVKNVLAIAAGIVDGKGLGASASAALVTRSFAELCRFGEALGAKPETLRGLSGLGDLLLSCSSPQSRNMSLGRELGRGRSLADCLAARITSEGVHTATAVARIATARSLDMPVCKAVAAIIAGTATVDQNIEALLARPLKAED